MAKAEGRAISRFLRYNPGTRELAAQALAQQLDGWDV
jgi:hypothetical protein